MKIMKWLLLLIIFKSLYCTYEAKVLQSFNISNSISIPNGFSIGSDFFCILDMDGVYTDPYGFQKVYFVHLNIYNKNDLSVKNSIDLTNILNAYNDIDSLLIEHYGGLIYFQNRVLFGGRDDQKGYFYEYNINTQGIGIVNNLPEARGSFGYNHGKSVVWIDDTRNYAIKEYSFNSQDNTYSLSTTVSYFIDGAIRISAPVYMNEKEYWEFFGGFTPIDDPLGQGGSVPDSFLKFEKIGGNQIYESNIPLNYSCLPQIIPEGDIVWAVCEDKNDGKYYILKLDPFGGQPPPGCDSQSQAFSLPSYFQNFGLLAVALGYFGFRRKKKRL
jgi:hypothetical protein